MLCMKRFTATLVLFMLFNVACAADKPFTSQEPPPGTTIVHPADGAIMVYVPSGSFIMGMDRDEADALAKSLGYKDYHQVAAEEWFPRRREWARGYFIDRYEVTIERWRRFVSATDFEDGDKTVKAPLSDDPDAFALYPIVRVHWDEAQQYANWAGKMLPSEMQWEKAARGTDGRHFPWGNALPAAGLGVFTDLPHDKPTEAAPVGSFPKGVSPYGCMDMAGNVYEWTREWFEPYPNNPEHQRLHSYTGHRNVALRGGSFYHAKHAFISAKRFGLPPSDSYYHIGFRTVWEPPADYFQSQAYRDARDAVAARETAIEQLRGKASKVSSSEELLRPRKSPK